MTQNIDGHFDVLIAGAGISGIGSAYHLQTQCPGKTYLVLEALEDFGGTWRMHTYPGIRSDSDLYTFGYRFKPWIGPPIATAEEILNYMGEVIDENEIAPHIQYSHTITAASYSSKEKLWTVRATNSVTGEEKTYTCTFLWMCQGYYNHAEGYTPEWDGIEDFAGEIIHPQTWPEDIDLNGKKVVCIGSGATAATLVPAIAGECEHVTLLQRSPTYFFPAENRSEFADELRRIGVSDELVHELARKKALFDQDETCQRCLTEPDVVKAELLEAAREYLGPDFDIDTHFTPHYRPWQQRLAFIPDGDLFQGIASGAASVVTDEIERFTKTGLQLKSGEHLDADIIVTATGFNLAVLGGIPFEVDGAPVDFSQTVTYRGMMFTGVPNMAWVFGYFRASWTLRVDLMGDFVCRLLNHMDSEGMDEVRVELRVEDKDMEILPWMDADNFNPGYLMRSMHLMPKRGSNPIWEHTQDYWKERDELPTVDLTAEEFVYSRRAVARSSAA
ncbi:MAG: NAD(P)/FAD-dependent oxidoreductase [Henriciella sp.]|nr:NAD(P)/FAD-dependent oxidoreductase [Henriciella sp.]MBO6696901.1 NAD(P)/FAD-dependent oxidoreductase [Henriciella sp.]